MNKHDLRVMKTKQGIHQALLKLLKSIPLDQIKVTELCREANINRGTFYFHYEEVGNVFKELFEEAMCDLEFSYNEPYRLNNLKKIDQLDPKTVRIFHHVKKYEDFYRIVLSQNVSTTFYYMLFEEIKKNIVKDKNTTVMNEMNPYFHSYTANALMGLIIEWYRRDFKESVDEMNFILVKILNYR